jgi:HK97 family phage major capsid protein
MPDSTQALREKRDLLYQEATAHSAKADQENRTLAADEQKVFDDLLGQVEELDKSIERREKLLKVGEHIQKTERLTRPEAPANELTAHNPEPARLTVPATARFRHGKLKAFTGPNAEEDAYRAGRFLLATVYGDHASRLWCVEHGVMPKQLAQGSTVNTAGSVLVPDELERAIIDLRELYGVFRREARVRSMMSDTLIVPRRTGGLTAYFVDENPSSGITQSEKAWDSVKLVAKKLATLTLYSSEIAEDAIISMADDLAGEIGYAFAKKEDDCGFLGDGTSTYGGIHGATVKINDGNHAASIYTAPTGSLAYSDLTLADFHGVTGKLPLYARANAKWYCHAAAFANSMERLMYAAGGNTVSTIGGGSGPSFLGYPVVFSQVLNSTLSDQTSTILLLFGDLKMAASMGSRRGVSIAQSDQRYFELDQIGIRGLERIDIVVHDLGDGSTAGPLIALKTPAS